MTWVNEKPVLVKGLLSAFFAGNRAVLPLFPPCAGVWQGCSGFGIGRNGVGKGWYTACIRPVHCCIRGVYGQVESVHGLYTGVYTALFSPCYWADEKRQIDGLFIGTGWGRLS